MAEREPVRKWSLAAVAGLALAWRVAYVLVWRRNPLVFADGLYYHLQANALADGRGFIDPIKFAYLQGAHPSAAHPPLFSLVLFGVTRSGRALGLGGFDSPLVHELTCAVLSTAAVVVIGLLAHRVAGARTALIAAALAAAYPPLWTSDALVMSESLFALTIALVLYTVYASNERPTWWNATACGLAIGAATLTRSEAVLLVPAVGIPFVFSRTGQSRPARARAFGVIVVVVAAVCAPWVVRNVRTFHRTVLLSENVDSVVAGANCPTTYYGAGIGSWDVRCNQSPTTRGDESDVGAALLHRGSQYARRHEARVPVVVAARVGRTFLVFDPLADRTESGRSSWTQWATVIAYFPMQLLAICGVVLLRRRRIITWPLVAMALLVVVTTALTYGISRFRVPWDVASVLAAGVAVDSLLARRVTTTRTT